MADKNYILVVENGRKIYKESSQIPGVNAETLNDIPATTFVTSGDPEKTKPYRVQGNLILHSIDYPLYVLDNSVDTTLTLPALTEAVPINGAVNIITLLNPCKCNFIINGNGINIVRSGAESATITLTEYQCIKLILIDIGQYHDSLWYELITIPAGVGGGLTLSGVKSDIQIAAAIAKTHDLQDLSGLQPKAAFNSVYRTLLDSSGSHSAAKVANTYGLGQGDIAAVTGTGTLYPLNTIYIAVTDYPTIDGKAAKLRVRAIIECNDVAPFTGTFKVGLHPVTRPATSGAAGLCIYTIGAPVANSQATLTNPAADSQNALVSTDFDLPADGFYVLAVVTSGTMATSSHVHISASLQIHNA